MRIYKVLYRLNKSLFHIIGANTWKKTNLFFLKKLGVHFPSGTPAYIDPSAYFDADYEMISIGRGGVISRNVTILTHDYSITRALIAIGHEKQLIGHRDHVAIGDNCFIGAQCLLLPGTRIGNNCIIGAGAVVKGKIPDNSVVIGNPCRVLETTEEYATKYLNRQTKE